MEPEVGRGIVENTNQSRHADGNPSPTLTNQVDMNSELLQVLPAPGDDPSVSLLPDPEGNYVPSVTPDISAEASSWSMMSSASPHSGPGYLVQDSMLTEDVDWRNPNQTSLSSPPTQSMVHADGYDPNRIPSSVFTDTPASPMDWSTASNESLFSIYMGNSFSGYQGMNSPQNPFEIFEAKANEGSNYSPNLPALPETFSEPETQQSENIKDDNRIQEGPSEKSTAMSEEIKDHGNKAYHEETKAASSMSPHKGGLSPFERTNSIQNRLSNESATNSIQNRLSNESAQSSSSKNRLSNESAKSSSSKNRLSDESTKSSSSFAFPVLVSDFRKSSSFRLKSDKKEEPQIKQKSEPPKPVTQQRQQAVRRRCCSSFIPGWLKCC